MPQLCRPVAAHCAQRVVSQWPLFAHSGRPGWRLRTAKPPYRRRSRPECSDSNSDRLAAHLKRLAPATRWCFVTICTIRSASRRRPAGSRFFFAFYRRLRLLRGAARSSSSICHSLKTPILALVFAPTTGGDLRHAPRPPSHNTFMNFETVSQEIHHRIQLASGSGFV
jgi:hypothetical protein